MLTSRYISKRTTIYITTRKQTSQANQFCIRLVSELTRRVGTSDKKIRKINLIKPKILAQNQSPPNFEYE